jgi:hypothetical protein
MFWRFIGYWLPGLAASIMGHWTVFAASVIFAVKIQKYECTDGQADALSEKILCGIKARAHNAYTVWWPMTANGCGFQAVKVSITPMLIEIIDAAIQQEGLVEKK